MSIIVILMKASVIIPTYNGGNFLVEVINSLINQQFTEKWEVVLIDSESTDGSISKISSLASKNSIKLKVIKIDRRNFSHGVTRNEAIFQCSGEFIALLTQDSVPADKYWLQQLINGFDRDEVAGVFGKHKAHKYHPRIIARDLDRHFHLMSQKEYRTSREWFQSKHDLQKQQLLHFFSNNNSAIRKSVWNNFRFPSVDFGEDQTWARFILEAGYSIKYQSEAKVYHSHKFGMLDTYKRAKTEKVYFRKYFGYDIYGKEKNKFFKFCNQIYSDTSYSISKKEFPICYIISKAIGSFLAYG